jgi:hypothetical protein
MKGTPSLETRAKIFRQNYEAKFKKDWIETFQTQDKLYRQKKRKVKWYGSYGTWWNEKELGSQTRFLILMGAEWCLHYLETGKMIKPPMYQCEHPISRFSISDQHQFYLEGGEYVFLITLFCYGWEIDITVEAMVE